MEVSSYYFVEKIYRTPDLVVVGVMAFIGTTLDLGDWNKNVRMNKVIKIFF